MTVVRLPVRIRLELAEDQLNDPDTAELISSAVDSATTRAVDRARAVRLVSEAAELAESGAAPMVSVSYRGDVLPQWLASNVEASVRASAAVAAARLGTAPGYRPKLVTAGQQGELLDELSLVPDRNRPAADAYLVPSYDSRGRPVPVTLRGRRRPGHAGPPTRIRLRAFGSEQELWSAVLSRFGGAPPPRLVAIFGGGTGQDTAGEMAIIDVDADGRPAILSGSINVWQPPAGTGPAQLATATIFQADTWRFRQRADSAAEVLSVRAEIYLEQLRREPGHRQVSEDQLRAQARQQATDIPLSREGTHQFFELLFQGSRVWVGEFLGTDMPTDTRPAVVFTEETAVDPKASAGYGANCPPLETSLAQGWLASFGLLNPDPQVLQEAFLSEPPIEHWPPATAAQLTDQVKAIASQLHMSPTRFAGGFLIGAMAHIDNRCRNLARSGAPLRYQLAEMAAAFGPIGQLVQFYQRKMVTQDEAEALPCPLASQSRTWITQFNQVFFAARDDAVASMFVSTCQDVLLQVLISTGHEISRRMRNFPQYMTVTRLLLVILLSDTPKLSQLRDKLVEQEQAVQSMFTIGPAGPMLAAWTLAREDMLAASSAGEPTEAGTVARRNGTYRVLDEAGRWWSRAELDSVLSAERQQALSSDALLDKVADLPDLVGRMQAAQRRDQQAAAATGTTVTAEIDDEFRRLLTKVQQENARRTRQVADDRSIAFGLATFERQDFGPENDIGARLSGIHKLADERLRQAFTDQDAYREGLQQLAATEISRAEFIEFFSFVGITLIAVFCPPAAAVIGGAQALLHLDEVLEHRGIQQAMLGGDEIISKAQVEAELWGAVIGVALSFLPELPAAARGAKAIVKGEATEAAAAAARQMFRQVSAHLAEMSIEHFGKAFVKKAATMYVLNLGLSAAIGRVTTAVEEEVTRTGHASIGDLSAVVDRAIHGATADGGAP